MHDQVDDARHFSANYGLTGGVRLEDNRGQSFAMARQNEKIRNRVIRRRIIYRSSKNDAFMRLKVATNFVGQRIAFLKTADQQQPHRRELPVETHESASEFGNTFVGG